MQEEIELSTYKDVVGLFPTVTKLAEVCGVPLNNAVQWKRRDSIPPKYWRAIIDWLDDHGVEGIDIELFLDFEEE